MGSVRWTEEAAEWLEAIYDYIAEDNPSAAAKVVNEIHERVRLLAAHPRMGHKLRDARKGMCA